MGHKGNSILWEKDKDFAIPSILISKTLYQTLLALFSPPFTKLYFIGIPHTAHKSEPGENLF